MTSTLTVTLASGPATASVVFQVAGLDLGELESWVRTALYRRGWSPCERCRCLSPATAMVGKVVLCPECADEGDLFGTGAVTG